METVGWGFQVKAGEEATYLGRLNAPVFPLEPVQPGKAVERPNLTPLFPLEPIQTS